MSFCNLKCARKNEALAENLTEAINLVEVDRTQHLGIDPEIAEDLFIRHGAIAFENAIERLEARLSMPGPSILSLHVYLKSLLSGKAIDKLQVLPSHIGELMRLGDLRLLSTVAPKANEVELRQTQLRESESKRAQMI